MKSLNRCLIAIQNLTKSGSPQTFLHVIELLKKKGFVVDVFVYAIRDKKIDLYFYDEYKKVCNNIFVSHLKLNGLSYKLFPFTKFRKIKKVIKTNNYNFVLSNNIYLVACCSANQSKLNNPKLIYYALGNVNIKSKFAIIQKKENYVRKFIKNIDAYIALSSVAIPNDGIAPKDRVYKVMDYPNEFFPSIKRKPIQDEIIMGQIGYYCSNKNQLFSLAVLKKLIDCGQKARLMFIGFKLSEEPRYFDEMMSFIEKNNLSQYVTFLPADYNKKDFFEHINVLLLPSLYEGLSITLLEAQFSNVFCVASEFVPKDVDFGLCHFSELRIGEWATTIVNIKNNNKSKPIRRYEKQDFERAFSNIIDDVMK